jgi:plastocyanin
MKQIIILVAVAIILIGVVVFLYSGNVEVPISIPSDVSKTTVIYSDSGYSPSTIVIKKGDTLIFENKSSKMMWTASAVHPTHKAYPGSGIEKCGTNMLVANFDSCRGYNLGESWEFQFTQGGVWKYHNHLQPNHMGMIVVE